MSRSRTKEPFELLHPRPEHFEAIQELCRKVYPFSKPWSMEQLESHRSYFPGGQLIVIDTKTKKVVGLAFSLIISWDDYSPQDNWTDFTSGGFFHNHNPQKGKTLYGAEVMVDPELRGLGIGKMLYRGRQEIVRKYNLKRIRAGARLRGFGKFQDKLTPYEYVVQVVAKKIFDPTLSFQLGQGFSVIDVAKNYLYNDPESLGHAAVIEWLNPDVATARDFKKQKDSAEAFLKQQKFEFESLPKELHKLVRKATAVLGEIIRETEGQQFYNSIEKYRGTLKKMRGVTPGNKLHELLREVEKETPTNQFKIAHAFALQLEIVNSCETAYRTWRQRLKPLQQGLKQKIDLKFVLTAHPTEARSQIVVNLLQKLTELLVDGLNSNFVFSEDEFMSQVRLLWKIPLSKQKSPSVLDEAEFIFSLIFSDKIFDFFISEKASYDLRLNTWVGGDKDGHPGVNADVMKSCLTLSRGFILRILHKKLTLVLSDLHYLGSATSGKTYKTEILKGLIKDLDSLRKVTSGDGNRVKKWSMKFRGFYKASPVLIKKHYEILLILRMLEVFPAFVVPIEFREDAGEIEKALTDKQAAIRRMLTELNQIAAALDFKFYARSMVISHCETAQDIQNAGILAYMTTQSKGLPVIPLFESKDALVKSKEILKTYLKDKSNVEQVRRHWLGRFEVMLGYSDSSKEIGVFPSRLLIQKAMTDIESVLSAKSIKPIFFHGSGGSVARGGGSLKEQISWWPNSAIESPKLTVQGEMVQRTFATKEILNSQCTHLRNEAMLRRLRKVPSSQNPVLKTFAASVEAEYKKLVSNPEVLERMLNASPYKYLEVLRIGSRPARRRSGELTVSSLRAIPWVLCWTQNRSLLPTWWGVGTAWTKLSKSDKEKFQADFKENPFCSTFVKSLGFTLAKVEPEVWKLYFDKSTSPEFIKGLETEFKAAVEFVLSVTGEKKLIWHRPWLEESIHLRAPHVHILNALQIVAMRRGDEGLLKETLVGIACGMLTTG